MSGKMARTEKVLVSFDTQNVLLAVIAVRIVNQSSATKATTKIMNESEDLRTPRGGVARIPFTLPPPTFPLPFPTIRLNFGEGGVALDFASVRDVS